MFFRLLALFLTVILACVGVLSVLTYLHLRNTAIDSRLDQLEMEEKSHHPNCDACSVQDCPSRTENP